jgi:beta-lactamase regulating signal transducer with metallopeptidase domain
MSDLLLDLIRANLALSAAIALVLLLRGPIGRRLGARAAYALWAVPPLAALASLLPARTIVVTEAAAPAAPTLDAVPQGAVRAMAETPLLPPPDFLDVAGVAVTVWVLGALLTLGFLALQQRRFVRALGGLTWEAGMFRAARAGVGPALIGIFDPRIVVPADFEQRFNAAERDIVLAHEAAHLRAGDPLINAATAMCQCLCWFNPLVHVAAWRLRLDQELACDAAVIAGRPAARKPYAEAMLKTQGLNLSAPLACAWPTHPMKERIAMLKAGTPSASARMAGGAVVVGLAAFGGLAAWAAQPPSIETHAANPEAAHSARILAEQRADRRLAALEARDPAVSPRAHLLGGRLVEAINEGYPDSIRQLVEAGADVNHYSPGDGTPLTAAARLGDTRTARLLIGKGAHVDRPAPGDGSPLIMAAAHGRLEMVALLIQAQADVNQYVKYDETPLINASRHGDLAVVRYLLDHGADPNLAVPSGNLPGEMRSPLSMAANPLVAQYLKSRGARR